MDFMCHILLYWVLNDSSGRGSIGGNGRLERGSNARIDERAAADERKIPERSIQFWKRFGMEINTVSVFG